MPNINLIAQKRHDKARLERTIRRLFFLMSGLFIGAILLFTMLSARWFSIKAQVNYMQEELAKLQPTVDRIKYFEARTSELGPRIELYGNAREHTLRWYAYLQVVARSLPQNTWLTRLYPASKPVAPTSPDEKVADVVVNLTGVTLSQQLVGETMLSLNRYQSMMKTVDLHYTQQGKVGETPTVEFEIATDIKDLPAIFTGKPAQPQAPAAASETAARGASNENQTKS